MHTAGSAVVRNSVRQERWARGKTSARREDHAKQCGLPGGIGNSDLSGDTQNVYRAGDRGGR